MLNNILHLWRSVIIPDSSPQAARSARICETRSIYINCFLKCVQNKICMTTEMDWQKCKKLVITPRSVKTNLINVDHYETIW